MIPCPACGNHNVQGADHCAECHSNLVELGLPERAFGELGRRLISDSVMELKPDKGLRVLPENTVSQVVQAMHDQATSAAMVVHQGQLVGLFTERDFLMKIAHRYEELSGDPIRKYMTSGVESLAPDSSIAFSLNRMACKHCRHIAILQDGSPVAMAGTYDVLRYITRFFPATD